MSNLVQVPQDSRAQEMDRTGETAEDAPAGLVQTMYDANRTLERTLHIAIENSAQATWVLSNHSLATAIRKSKPKDAMQKTLGQLRDDTCVACQEKFKSKGFIAELGCGHLYHPRCLADLVERSPRCPEYPLCLQGIYGIRELKWVALKKEEGKKRLFGFHWGKSEHHASS